MPASTGTTPDEPVCELLWLSFGYLARSDRPASSRKNVSKAAIIRRLSPSVLHAWISIIRSSWNLDHFIVGSVSSRKNLPSGDPKFGLTASGGGLNSNLQEVQGLR